MKLFLLFSLFLSHAAFAQTQIKISDKQLAAAYLLSRPELNSVEIDGLNGIFTPAPSFKYLGMNAIQFPVDLSWLIKVVADVRFNHLKADVAQVSYANGGLEVDLPLVDKVAAVQSRLGTISVKGVVATVVLGWKTNTNGSQDLVVTSTRLTGSITGTGILNVGFILTKIRNLMQNTFADQAAKILAQPKIQEEVQTGLLDWSKFYTGTEMHEVVPGSIQFYNTATESGLVYQVD